MISALIPLVLPLFATVDPAPAAPSPIAAPVQDELVISFEEEGTRLEDFVDLVSKQLGKQIFYDKNEVGGTVINARGAAIVDASKLRGFIETTLYAHGFVLLQIGDALRLTSMTNSRSTAIRTQAKFVPVDKLDEYDGRYVLLTCVVKVKDRNMMTRGGAMVSGSGYGGAQEHVNALQSYFTNPMVESIRASGNGIVLTGFPHVLRHAVQVIGALEKQRDEAEAPLALRLAELEQELSALRNEKAVKKSDGR